MTEERDNMKRYIQRIITGIIVSAMIFGNFAGMGAPVVRAEDPELNIRVVNDNGQPVSGVQLILKNDELGNIEFDDVTDERGEATAAEALLDVTEEATYYVQPAPEDKEHICDNPIEVHFKMNSAGYGNVPYIDTVDGKKYEGDYVELKVKGSGTGKPIVNPEITSAKASITEAGRNGANAVITVTGKDIPDNIYYQIWYVIQSGGIDEVGKIQTVSANGSSTERKFNVKLPAVFEYPKAIGWKVNVTVVSNEYGKETEIIGITADSATGQISALDAALKESETLKEADYTVKSWRSYNSAIEAAKPLQSDVNASNASCRTALQTIEKAKAALVLKKDLAKAQTKAALNAAIKEAESLHSADYTAESWKRYSEAIEAGKILAAEEDATEVQCQAVIKQINASKATLVKRETSTSETKETKVSKITISGSSKNIAVGKKIKLTAKVSPVNATNKAVKWKSSNKKYATVDAKGNVTVKKAGAGKTVTITAAAADGSGKKASYKIKIMKNAVKSISLKANKSVKAGRSLKVKATVKTTGKNTNKTLKWTSSNTKYATVSANGVVKTKKAGKNKKVKITAAATDGSNKKKTITIKIK